MYDPKGETYKVTHYWLQNILAMSFIFTGLPFKVGASLSVLIFDKGSCLSCDGQSLHHWFLDGLVKFSHVFWNLIIQNITTTSYKNSTNHFHCVVVNDLYNHYSRKIGIIHLWACVGKNSFTIECFLKINTKIFLCSVSCDLQKWLQRWMHCALKHTTLIIPSDKILTCLLKFSHVKWWAYWEW